MVGVTDAVLGGGNANGSGEVVGWGDDGADVGVIGRDLRLASLVAITHLKQTGNDSILRRSIVSFVAWMSFDYQGNENRHDGTVR